MAENTDKKAEVSRNSNIDPRLVPNILPYGVWAKNGVRGDERSDYEYYLLELVNESIFFQEKSIGQEYHSPESEENGQCDAISANYELDFKTLISSSLANGKSNTEWQKEQIAEVGYFTVQPKNTTDEYKCSDLLRALRPYTSESILNGDYKNEKAFLVKDIQYMLKWLDKKKNLLMFLPIQFSVKDQIPQKEKQNVLKDAMQSDAYKLFELRKQMRPEFETFLCTIMESDFVIFRDTGEQLEIADFVNVNRCPTYIHLASLF